nr:Peptidase S7 and DEAD box domain containing protein [Haemonchus contortus]
MVHRLGRIQDTQSSVPDVVTEEGTKAVKLNNGVNAMYRNLLGWRSCVERAVVEDGIIHSKAHVTGRSCRWLPNGRKIQPALYSVTRDLVTWGGLLNISGLRDGETIGVMLVNHEETQFFTKRVFETMEGYFLASMPGRKYCRETLSGFPFYVARNGIFRLAGVLGDVLISQQMQEEILYGTEHDDIHVVPVSSHVTYVLAHSGAGKTRKVAVNMAREALKEKKKVLITVPTNVIATQLMEVLYENKVYARSLTFEARPVHRRVGALVAVITHGHLTHRLINEPRYLDRYGIVVVDEAHVKQFETMLLVKYECQAVNVGRTP